MGLMKRIFGSTSGRSELAPRDELQEDLARLFAVRDAHLAGTAAAPAGEAAAAPAAPTATRKPGFR